MKTYWTAHCRGCDYKQLRKLGFIVLEPKIDDYVFLEAKENNLKYVKQEANLNILFIRTEGKLSEVEEYEVKNIVSIVDDYIEVGDSIFIIGGTYSNLEGIVEEVKSKSYLCNINIFKRTISAEIDKKFINRRAT